MQFTNSNRVEPLYFHEAQQGEALLNNLGTESIIKRKRDESDERIFSDEHEVEKSGVEKSGVEKSGVEKSGVEKSGVEKSGVEKSGVEKSGVEKSGVEKSGVEKKHNICTSQCKTPLFSRFLV